MFSVRNSRSHTTSRPSGARPALIVGFISWLVGPLDPMKCKPTLLFSGKRSKAQSTACLSLHTYNPRPLHELANNHAHKLRQQSPTLRPTFHKDAPTIALQHLLLVYDWPKTGKVTLATPSGSRSVFQRKMRCDICSAGEFYQLRLESRMH
jgi:hypothetical protein